MGRDKAATHRRRRRWQRSRSTRTGSTSTGTRIHLIRKGLRCLAGGEPHEADVGAVCARRSTPELWSCSIAWHGNNCTGKADQRAPVFSMARTRIPCMAGAYAPCKRGPKPSCQVPRQSSCRYRRLSAGGKDALRSQRHCATKASKQQLIHRRCTAGARIDAMHAAARCSGEERRRKRGRPGS